MRRTAYLSFAICYLSFGLKGRRLSLARIGELGLNAVCANHLQIVHEIDASQFALAANSRCLASRVRSHKEEYR